MRGPRGGARAMVEMQQAGVSITTIPEEEWSRMEGYARELWQAYADEGGIAERGVNMLNDFLADLGRLDTAAE